MIGYIKGKSAISTARHFGGRQKNFTGAVFWVRRYFVSTVGLDEEVVRAYIRNQKKKDDRYDQTLWGRNRLRRITGYKILYVIGSANANPFSLLVSMTRQFPFRTDAMTNAR